MILDREASKRLSAVRRESRLQVAESSTHSLEHDIFAGWLSESETRYMFRMALNELSRRDVWYELMNLDLVTPDNYRQFWPVEEY